MHRRVLIIRPDRIGDVVLTTPLIRSIRESFPDSFIGVMVHPSNVPLLEGNPHINVLLTDDPGGIDAGKRGFWKQVGNLRKHNFNVGLMPFPRERHAWMMSLAGISFRVGVGHKLYQMITFTRFVSRRKYIPLRHEAEYMLDLGLKIGATFHTVTPRLYLTEEEKMIARSGLVSRGISFDKSVIAVNPLSRSSSPNWKPERYTELIERLLLRYSVIINLGPHEVERRALFSDVENLGAVVMSQPLRDHMATVANCDLLISSSTGSMHIAAALRVPTLSLFCPLTACSPLLWGPLGNRSEVLLPAAGYCQQQCPGDPKICPLDDIQVDQVIKQVVAVLSDEKRTRS